MSFERFTLGRLFYVPGIVKLWESPGRAGGLLMIINKTLDCFAQTFPCFPSSVRLILIPLLMGYPEECQEYFDSWAESLEEEEIE